MTRKDATGADSSPNQAARHFVRADVGERGADTELARWLDERPENERALERVELAAALGKRLAAEPGSALYAEAARVTRIEPRERGWGRPLAWSGALAAVLLAAVLVVRDAAQPDRTLETVTIEAARVVTFDAPRNAVAVLPSGVVVDASAVAVLPFSTSGDAALAAGLESDVVAALRGVPGLYVIADRAVAPYAATQLDATDIGGQLGARGIVDTDVQLADGRVRINAQLRDAASGATLWRTDFDRPIEELRAVRYEIADGIAGAMLDSSLREQLVRADRFGGPISASKPFQQ